MKKLLYSIGTLCAALFCSQNAQAQSDDTGLFFEVDGIYYAVYVYMNPEENATVVAGTKPYQGDVTIPESVTYDDKTYDVTRIADYAFSGNASLSTIAIPASVNYIGKDAFKKCSQLKGVYITDLKAWCNTEFVSNPLSYAHNLFLNGELVTHLQIPMTVTEIPELAFIEAYCIESVVFPESLATIGNSAFSMCTGIKQLIIPEPVSSIGNSAFYYNTSLTHVWLPATLREIGGYAFAQCTSLEQMSVKVPYGTMVTMGLQPFYGSTASTGTLYVPADSRSTYANKTGWGDWKEIVENEQLEVSKIMKVDIFQLPYGRYENETWEKVAHLNDYAYIFYGNDINENNYADLSEYEFLKLHGKADQTYYVYINGKEPTEVVLDENGDQYLDLSEFGDEVRLRGIRIAQADDPEKQEHLAAGAYAKAIRILDDGGITVSGSGTLPDALNNYTFYDFSGVTQEMTLILANPNALVVEGNKKITGVANILKKSNDCEDGFVASSISITDGYDFCYDNSVKCPTITYNRDGISSEDEYTTVMLPFAVDASKGTYQYVDCDGSNLYFASATGTIPAYTPLLVKVGGTTEIALSGTNLLALYKNGDFNITDAPATANDMKFGFVTKRQEKVSLDENAEVKDYNVYGYSIKSHKFVKATNTFTINPFRTFFLLPKGGVKPIKGKDAAAGNPSALNIVIDGEGADTDSLGDVLINGGAGDGVTYNLLGLPVGPGYRGIAIRNGKKVIIK